MVSVSGPREPVPDVHPLLDVLAGGHGGGGAGQVQEPAEEGGLLLTVWPMVMGTTTVTVTKCLGAQNG